MSMVATIPPLLLLLLLLLIPVSASNNTTFSSLPYPIALRGCKDRCGDIPIPYPFGIGTNCSLNPWFDVLCQGSPPTPVSASLPWSFTASSRTSDSQIKGINLDPADSTLTISGSFTTYVTTYVELTVQQQEPTLGKTLNMSGSPYVLMGSRNVLVLKGCGGSVLLNGATGNTVAGCSSVCSTTPDKGVALNTSEYRSCYGIDCCQASIPFNVDFIATSYTPAKLGDTLAVSDTQTVDAGVFGAEYIANQSIRDIFLDTSPVWTILQWRAPGLPVGKPEYSNSSCQLYKSPDGYSCNCKSGYYTGNPYLPNGCQVIKECEGCPDNCLPTPTLNNSISYSCPRRTTSIIPIAVGLGICLGTLLLSILLYVMYRWLKHRKEIMQKKNNFKKNGGLILQQQLSTGEDVIERIKVYTSDELEKATDNFNENRIVGRGGQGTVYKGMLEDGTITAIKRSEKVKGLSQLNQFINEVVILSKLNHRNIVKLFGCCLETEVPLLVYEYVINGTLSQNIRNPAEEFQLNWNMRLQIAIQSAEALAYLHSSSYPPIYHRDIKTSNILLDDKYRAKVSDFGISKTIKIDQTHMTNTHVEGTFGYIDPEFYRSSKYTDKSDVYSFGVVLVELMTSKKAVYEDKSLAINLASTFLDLKQNNRLYDIIDANVLEEAKKEELKGVADLAERCLQMIGIQRPTMKEVVTTLLMITAQHGAPIPSSNQVSNGRHDLVGEFSSSNSIMYGLGDYSPDTQEQPLFSNSFSISSDFN